MVVLTWRSDETFGHGSSVSHALVKDDGEEICNGIRARGGEHAGKRYISGMFQRQEDV